MRAFVTLLLLCAFLLCASGAPRNSGGSICQSGATAVKLHDPVNTLPDPSSVSPSKGDLQSTLDALDLPVHIRDATFCLPPTGETLATGDNWAFKVHVEFSFNAGSAASVIKSNLNTYCGGDPDAAIALRIAEPYDVIWNGVWDRKYHSADMVCKSATYDSAKGVGVMHFGSVNKNGNIEAPPSPAVYNLNWMMVKANRHDPQKYLGDAVLPTKIEVLGNSDGTIQVATVEEPESIGGKLRLDTIYFFYDTDIVVDTTITPNNYTFYNQARHKAGPDPSPNPLFVDIPPNQVNVILVRSPGNDPEGLEFWPNKTLEATPRDEKAELASLFYPTQQLLDAAKLKKCGFLTRPSVFEPSGYEELPVFCGRLTMPAVPTSRFRLGWYEHENTVKRHGGSDELPFHLESLQAFIEVTCDDGNFCNGPEYYIRGQCVPSDRDPCIFDDTDLCLQHACDKDTQLCKNISKAQELGQSCDTCGPLCAPKCAKGQKCGSGGCPTCVYFDERDTIGCQNDSYCGVCTGANEVCVDGSCVVSTVSNTPGSCANPYNMFDSVFDPETSTNEADRIVWAEHMGGNAASGYVVPKGGTLFRIEVPKVDNMEDNTTPSRGATGTQEHIFRFQIQDGLQEGAQGIEVMMIGLDGVNTEGTTTDERFANDAIDSYLAIHDGNCQPLAAGAALYNVESDDATPPGGVSSHVYTRLTPGNYSLVATFFSAQSGGPYVLMVKFTSSFSTCFPQCDGKFCGFDECEFRIGADSDATGTIVPSICGLEQYFGIPECNAGLTCLQGRCSNCSESYIMSRDYVSTCGNDGVCGVDQCNLLCSRKENSTKWNEPACSKGSKACDLQSHKCVPINPCDNFSPTCQGMKNGRTEERFCGSDCNAYRDYDSLPDLVPDLQELISKSMVFNWKRFNRFTCAIDEDCLGDISDILDDEFSLPLLRFDTNIINLGDSFKPDPPSVRPDLFEYSGCHGHFHFRDFASFDILSIENVTTREELEVIVGGGKRAYCMEDSIPYLSNENVECGGESTCEDQGIQYGWIDRYPNDLDCQWIVLHRFYQSNPDGGWYTYQVCTNFGRTFMETTFANNCRAFPILLPPKSKFDEWKITNSVVPYEEYLATRASDCDVFQGAKLPIGVEFPTACVNLNP